MNHALNTEVMAFSAKLGEADPNLKGCAMVVIIVSKDGFDMVTNCPDELSTILDMAQSNRKGEGHPIRPV